MFSDPVSAANCDRPFSSNVQQPRYAMSTWSLTVEIYSCTVLTLSESEFPNYDWLAYISDFRGNGLMDFAKIPDLCCRDPTDYLSIAASRKHNVPFSRAWAGL